MKYFSTEEVTICRMLSTKSNRVRLNKRKSLSKKTMSLNKRKSLSKNTMILKKLHITLIVQAIKKTTK